MTDLHFPGEPWSQSGYIALAYLYRPHREPPTNHLGVCFQTVRGRVRLLHLAWHHQLKVADAPRDWVMIEPALEPETARVLARLCGHIERSYSRRPLAYALRYKNGRFDPETGDFLSEGGLGLTCATFVIALFASYGAGLLNAHEWGPREDDHAWQEWIVRELRDGGAEEDHVRAIEEEIGCARFRPEEVAAAGTAEELPAGFVYSAAKGKSILEMLTARIAR